MNEPAFRRRAFIGSMATTCLAAAALSRNVLAASAKSASTAWPGYASATPVDALCMPGDVNSTEDALSAADVADVRASGITAINLTVGSVGSYANDYTETIAQLASWDAQIAAHPEAMLKFSRVADLVEAKRSGRLAVIYGFQDATPLGDDLDRLDTFRGLGVRILQLTYNIRNLVGDGCMEPGNAGLSRFGRSLVERMNAHSMLVDLSHCGQRTTDEAIDASTQPVAITHSGCSAVYAHPRNKNDDTLRKLTRRGGVFGIYLMPYLRSAGQATGDDVIAHIEHAIDVCGEDHVGIGSDNAISAVHATDAYKKMFAEQVAKRRTSGIAAPREDEQSYAFVADLNTPRRLETIAGLLAARRHPDRVIAKVIGGNFMRLFNETFAEPKSHA